MADNDPALVTHAELHELTIQLSSLVVELKNDRENRKESEVRFREENDKLWSKVERLEENQIDIKTRLPTLEEMKENQNKIRSSVVTALLIAALIGGLTTKFAGA